MKDRIYKVLIIGAGRIAAGFDGPDSKGIFTHAHAFKRSSRTSLIGFVDIDSDACRSSADKWSAKCFSCLEDAFREESPDILVISTPDSDHFKSLSRAMLLAPKLIVCEKPLVATEGELSKILTISKKNNIPVLVNYSRRFDPYVIKLRKDIHGGEFGKIISASGIYTKGILHNGSHMMDLCRYLFGEMKKFDVFHSLIDYKKSDPTISLRAEFERCKNFFLVNGDERKCSIFELDIITEKKRIRLSNFGFDVEEQEVENDPLFEGWKALSVPKRFETGLKNALPEMVKNAVDFLDGKVDLASSLSEAIKTQKTCFILSKGRR